MPDRHNVILMPINSNLKTCFPFFFTPNEMKNYDDVLYSDWSRFKKFYLGLLDEGIYFSPSPFEANFLSVAHTMADLDITLEAIKKVLNRV